MSGDAADEVVRIMLNGTEVAVRLAGSGVKNLAAMLIAWSKKEKKPYGKTNMMRLLKSGEELQVISLDREQYKQFKTLAKKKVLYAPFLNTKEEDGKVEVVISSKSIPLVNYILKKIGYGDVQQDESTDLSKKKQSTPSQRSSSEPTTRSTEVAVERTTLRSSSPEPESVAAKLEANRQFLEQKNKEQSGKGRSKTKKKDRSR
ncbi:MAG: PcfB family protein [Clostridia bacterium]|nr:PcfB family protein [Clostridia bacterium]